MKYLFIILFIIGCGDKINVSGYNTGGNYSNSDDGGESSQSYGGDTINEDHEEGGNAGKHSIDNYYTSSGGSSNANSCIEVKKGIDYNVPYDGSCYSLSDASIGFNPNVSYYPKDRRIFINQEPYNTDGHFYIRNVTYPVTINISSGMYSYSFRF